jgi:hypothetical protein
MECVQLAGAFGPCWHSTAAASCAQSKRFARFGHQELLEAVLLRNMDPDPYITLIEAPRSPYVTAGAHGTDRPQFRRGIGRAWL